jgi:hypothetical protein
MMNKNELIAQLEAITEELQEILGRFSEEQLNTITPASGWTAGQIAEHIAKSAAGEVLYGNTATTTRPPGEKLPAIRELFLNHDLKFNAAEQLLPGEGPYKKEEVLSMIDNTFRKLKGAAWGLYLDATCTDREVGMFGQLTRYEWIGLITVHTQRHIQQLMNVYASLNA